MRMDACYELETTCRCCGGFISPDGSGSCRLNICKSCIAESSTSILFNRNSFMVYLIEYSQACPCPVYVPEYHGGFYTCNPWAAKRFISREAAEEFMKLHNYALPWQAIAHGFEDN